MCLESTGLAATKRCAIIPSAPLARSNHTTCGGSRFEPAEHSRLGSRGLGVYLDTVGGRAARTDTTSAAWLGPIPSPEAIP